MSPVNDIMNKSARPYGLYGGSPLTTEQVRWFKTKFENVIMDNGLSSNCESDTKIIKGFPTDISDKQFNAKFMRQMDESKSEDRKNLDKLHSKIGKTICELRELMQPNTAEEIFPTACADVMSFKVTFKRLTDHIAAKQKVTSAIDHNPVMAIIRYPTESSVEYLPRLRQSYLNMQDQLPRKIPDWMVIKHMITQLNKPDMYGYFIEQLENVNENEETFEEVYEKAMTIVNTAGYILKERSMLDSFKNTAVTLAGAARGGSSKLVCFNCSGVGHKAGVCPSVKTKTGNQAPNGQSKNGKSKFDKKEIECFGCGQKGHIKSECPNKGGVKNNNVVAPKSNVGNNTSNGGNIKNSKKNTGTFDVNAANIGECNIGVSEVSLNGIMREEINSSFHGGIFESTSNEDLF